MMFEAIFLFSHFRVFLLENEKIKNLFLDNGFVVVPKLFEEETISTTKNLINDFDYSKISDLVFDEGGKLPKYLNGLNYHIKYLNNFFSSKLLNLAKVLLDQEVYFNILELHNKLPEIGTFTPPHQDNFYWYQI